MPLKILIVPDKFKGTLSAGAAAMAIARGWHRARPQDSLDLIPMSDGGDGFGEVIGNLLNAETCRTKTVDAAHRPCEAKWWWEPETRTAIIESAQVIGLALLPPKKFHPFELDTFGLGAVLCAASEKGARCCLVGIGGSATNDGGFGLARALGWKFFDRAGKSIERWIDLPMLAHLDAPKHRRWFSRLIVAVDVQNRLLGQRGATRVYGPQKGLRPRDLAPAENCLRRLAKITADQLSSSRPKWLRGLAYHELPGTGAAGGLGFGLVTFLGAKAEPGFNWFTRCAELSVHLQAADLVITGEGCIEQSTFMGKGVGQIASCCQESNVPCIAFAGDISKTIKRQQFFSAAQALTDICSATQAKSRAAFWLERLASDVASALDGSRLEQRTRIDKAKA